MCHMFVFVICERVGNIRISGTPLVWGAWYTSGLGGCWSWKAFRVGHLFLRSSLNKLVTTSEIGFCDLSRGRESHIYIGDPSQNRVKVSRRNSRLPLYVGSNL